jgi:hypothetical protein
MRLSILAGALVAGLAAAGGASAQVRPAVACHADKDIRAADRAAPEKVALGLVNALLTGDEPSVDAVLTQEARDALGPDGLDRMVQSIGGEAPYSDIRVAHSYLLEVSSGDGPLPPSICGKSPTDPDAVLLATRALPRQAHIEVTAKSRNNEWSVFVFLAPSPTEWRVLGFEMHLAGISGRSSTELQRLALEQKARGHGLNATLLMKAAASAADRGANAKPVWKLSLDAALKGLETPPEMSGEAPYLWSLDDRSYSIASLGVVGVGGNLVLMVYRLTDAWPGVAAVDADSRALIGSLTKAHPELKESFPAIIVRTLKPDRSGGWATGFEFAKGFGQPPPPDSPPTQ